MCENKFEKAINYNIESISDYNDYYTSNLSSLTYNLINKSFPLLMNYCFNIGKIISPTNAVIIEKTETGTYTILTEPRLKKLAIAFDTNIEDTTVKTEEEAKKIKIETIRKIIKAINKLRDFVKERNDFLDGKKEGLYDYPIFPKENKNELSEMILLLNKTLPEKTLTFKDFFYKPGGLLGCFKDEIKVPGIYSYISLREECAKIAKKTSDYYDYFPQLDETIKKREEYAKKLSETTDNKPLNAFFNKRIKQCDEKIEELTSILDKINELQMFNRETFAFIYIKLDKLIKKEEALNEFVNSIIN